MSKKVEIDMDDFGEPAPELATRKEVADKQNDTRIVAEKNEEVPRPNVAKAKLSMGEIKTNTLRGLLSKINVVDFNEKCKTLGWEPKLDEHGKEKPPLQKHIKVAIIDDLMQTAKINDWHLVKDGDFVYIFNGAFWIPLDPDELENFLKDAAIKMGYPEIESRDSTFIKKLHDQSLQDGFFMDKYTEKQSMINLQNGTLVLSSTGIRMKDFDHRDFLTHQLDFHYDPEARNDIFLKFLDEVLPDKDTQRTLQEVAGFLFLKGIKLEFIFFLYGGGSNGKSVFFEVLTGVLGADSVSNYSIESLTDENGYFRARIKDKIVNYGTDIKLQKLDAGMFKTLASGEPIEARLPYGQPFIMKDYAKLIFNVNKMDNANIEHTHGFYRRLLIIPFLKTIEEENQDIDLHHKILQDKAGVLNWIIKGAESVVVSRKIFTSKECKQVKEQFVRDTDSAAIFIDEENFEKAPGVKYPLKQLHSEYQDFCRENGHTRPLANRSFSKRIEQFGHTKGKDNTGVYFEIRRGNLS